MIRVNIQSQIQNYRKIMKNENSYEHFTLVLNNSHTLWNIYLIVSRKMFSFASEKLFKPQPLFT
jgi:hypothetical protein